MLAFNQQSHNSVYKDLKVYIQTSLLSYVCYNNNNNNNNNNNKRNLVAAINEAVGTKIICPVFHLIRM